MVRLNMRLPSISATEALIIQLLDSGERFGLDLVDNSNGRLKRGTIYVTLTRMEAKGFVESRQEARDPGAGGLPRRMYRVTAYGAKVHAASVLLREALALKPATAQ
jgi:DNA-binding PadR family transcriptional regulator